MYEELKEVQILLWKDGGDSINQESLFAVQEKLAEVLYKVAIKEKHINDLVSSFPWLYEEE